jgi:hypothetical protein
VDVGWGHGIDCHADPAWTTATPWISAKRSPWRGFLMNTVMMTRSAKVSPVALRSEPSEVVQARDAKPRLSGQDAVHLLRFARLHVEDGAPEPHGDHGLEPVLDMSQ